MALPRPNIDVEVSDTAAGPGKTAVNVTIKRGDLERKYNADHPQSSEAVKEVVRQIISDPVSAEWLPEPKKP